ncbi:MAG: PrsW family intramembrane metalloprotease [Lachnospiraceae bacterium]|nr:PrsW family intramembrane metalloprotease [Lachnospiraceae bacterium]
MLALELIFAVFPGIIVFIMVYRLDKIEKEPASLLAKLLVSGILAGLLSFAAGALGYMVLQSLYTGKNLMFFQFADSFLLKALPEQVCIFLVLYLLTWKAKEFNYTFDAVVYAITIALGVTVTGNLIRIFRGRGFQPGVLLLSLVGHMISAVFMGCFYGKTKNCEGLKDSGSTRLYLAETLLIPAIMFGIYDFCMRIQTTVFYIFLIIYEIVCMIISLREIIYLSGHDTKLAGLADAELSKEEMASFQETERW